eukprot:1148597-Pelagomonas_calceolata.AAC.10
MKPQSKLGGSFKQHRIAFQFMSVKFMLSSSKKWCPKQEAVALDMGRKCNRKRLVTVSRPFMTGTSVQLHVRRRAGEQCVLNRVLCPAVTTIGAT